MMYKSLYIIIQSFQNNWQKQNMPPVFNSVCSLTGGYQAVSIQTKSCSEHHPRCILRAITKWMWEWRNITLLHFSFTVILGRWVRTLRTHELCTETKTMTEECITYGCNEYVSSAVNSSANYFTVLLMVSSIKHQNTEEKSQDELLSFRAFGQKEK